ncbi:uncharacterized protein LOC133325082 [Musca vetustissima]|uniref:uncharacterized protein LOC133325082 n=1 Tax=Musca vetustissima TaxID=27455 RepID=UPI002AB721FD|nr:uncharacterized protein LOC133325082 [Musca vetustissima]
MKIALIALLAGLSLVAVNASVMEIPSPLDEIDFEYIANDIADDVMDVDTQSWAGLYFVIHKVLTTVKGVNCTIKEVIGIRGAALKFLSDIHACGGEVSQKLQNLIDAVNNIISSANDIIHVNENICGNTDSDTTTDSTDGSKDVAATTMISKTDWNCFWKLLFKTLKLKNQIKHAIYLIKQIPSVPGATGECVTDAANTLSNYFTQFPNRVVECSKLVSN